MFIAKSPSRNLYVARINDSWGTTTDVNKAIRASKEKLKNVINNQLSKSIDYGWVIEEEPLIATALLPNDGSEFTGPHNAINRVESKETEDERTIHGCWIASENYLKLIDNIRDINSVCTVERANELNEKLIELDRELVDMEHFIEMTSMSAYEGYLQCKEMKRILSERREVKQELYIINAIINGKTISELASKILTDGKIVPKKYVCRTKYGESLPWKSKKVSSNK